MTEAKPSHAELCRALAGAARVATLSTLARDPVGYPFGSLVTVAFDDRGRALLLLSRLAEHTQNLEEHAEASLLIAEPPSPDSPLALGRATLLGPCAPVVEDERAVVRETFLEAHPDAAQYVDFTDFAFYRLEPIALRYVGGFGRMSWVSAADYAAAR